MQHILLLHGAIGSEAQFSSLCEQLASSAYRLHRFNFSGHGSTPMNGPLSMEGLADETLAFIQEQQIEKVNIFGYSMGGYVAMYLAALHPGLINKIVTLGTKYQWSPEIAAKEIKMLRPETIEEKVPAFAAALAQRHGQEQWKSLLYATADMLVQLGNKPLLNQQTLQQITTEVLLMIGEKDAMVSLEETKETQMQLKQSSLFVMPDTPHPIEQVNIELLTEKLLDFF